MIEGERYLNSEKEASEEENEAGKIVLLCIQVVRMRKISMLFGIEVTDTLSKMYAETLTDIAGANAVVGKVGVEDYAVLFRSKNEETVEALARRVSIVLENYCNNETLPAVLKEQSGFIAGAAFYNSADDISALFNKASVTLFSGTRLPGKICSFYDNKIERAVSGRDIVEHEIGEALKLGELELYYQPKISIKTGEIMGAGLLCVGITRRRVLLCPMSLYT